MRTWLAEDRDVFVYFNNDACGYAVRNAPAFMAESALALLVIPMILMLNRPFYAFNQIWG